MRVFTFGPEHSLADLEKRLHDALDATGHARAHRGRVGNECFVTTVEFLGSLASCLWLWRPSCNWSPAGAVRHVSSCSTTTARRRRGGLTSLPSRSPAAPVLELLVGHDLLELTVLPLELLEALGVVGLHAPELIAPPVIRLLRHLQVPGNLGNVRALVDMAMRWTCEYPCVLHLEPNALAANGMSAFESGGR